MTYEEFFKKVFPHGNEVANQGYVTVRAADLKYAFESLQKAPQGDTGPPGFIGSSDMKFVPKPWGWEMWICNNDLYCGKKLFIKAGHWLSYHHHEIKDEVLYVESGKVFMTLEGHTTLLSHGGAYHIKPYMMHQLEATEDTVIFEFSTKHMDEDSIRSTRDSIRGSKLNYEQ